MSQRAAQRRKGLWYGISLEHMRVIRVMPNGIPARAALLNIDGNIVLCENNSYASILVGRANALRESGNANNRKCRYCHKWDSPSRLVVYHTAAHRECKNAYQVQRRANRPAKERRIRRAPERNAMWRQGR
jgi:hypothetical protein